MSEQFSEATNFVSGQTYTWGSFDFTFTQNNSSNSNYHAGDAGVRFYQSDVLAVDGGNKVISKIEFTTYGGKTGPFTADCGTMTANTVWEGESSTVTFTASAQVRFSKITITYTEGEGGTEGGETAGGTLAWGSADFAAIQAAVGNELNATTLADVTATEDLIVNTDGITYKGLELSLGGGKFKFGTNYGVASQEGDKPTRIQVGGAGKLADMKQIISFEVPAAGTLKVDAVSSSKTEERPFAVAIDGNEVGQYTTVMQGQESTGEIFTIDCSAATAGSTIYVYSAKSGINFFTIEYTY